MFPKISNVPKNYKMFPKFSNFFLEFYGFFSWVGGSFLMGLWVILVGAGVRFHLCGRSPPAGHGHLSGGQPGQEWGVSERGQGDSRGYAGNSHFVTLIHTMLP
jgi:hypothetical protein